jgi:hypothetical protein
METTSAATLLNRAEEIDGYRTACGASFSNAAARRRCFYVASMVPPEEGDRLLSLVDEIPLLNKATVIVMHPTAENGYPHTRPLNIVCMPTTSIEGQSDYEIATTLRHEAIHLHQRANPEIWERACKKEGWMPVQASVIPLHLRSRCRLNPDTFRPQQFWAWEGRYVPLPLFSTETPSNLGDIVIKWYDLQQQQMSSYSPPTFQVRYGSSPSQPEHPFELLAVEAAEKGIISEEELLRNLL